MISGRSSDTTYEHTENLKPGKTSSVTAAPPSTCRRSSTSTRLPARARYAALTTPLWPPPMTMTSYFVFISRSFACPSLSTNWLLIEISPPSRERRTGTSTTFSHDLGQNRQRYFLGRDRTNIQTDGSAHALQSI